MKFIGIIPARYASTRFPGKPLADMAGKPMIQRVYERVAQSLDKVCVATDDRFRIKIHGKTQENVYAIGSVLSGFDALQEGCGAGVSLLTALYVADNLKK